MKPLLLLVLLAAPARADCLFDGDCAPAPALSASSSASGPAEGAETAGVGRWDGANKGATEGALFGFFAGLSPALALVEEGFGRRMHRAYDGAREDDGLGGAYYYGGMALAAVLYLPALVLGGLGGLFGASAGAVAPDSVSEWDAEKALFD